MVLDVRNMAAIPANRYNCIFCSGVLEHVDDFIKGLDEMTRILVPGGILMLGLPFRQAIHDAPYDFWRFTTYAVDYLLKDRYTIIEKVAIDEEVKNFPVAYWVKAQKR